MLASSLPSRPWSGKQADPSGDLRVATMLAICHDSLERAPMEMMWLASALSGPRQASVEALRMVSTKQETP
jgi:hypothetical protein